MNQQKKKILLIATVSILAIALIVAFIIAINTKEKKLSGNNELGTEINSEHGLNVGTEVDTEGAQEIEIEEVLETENDIHTTEQEEIKPKWTVADMNKTMYAKSTVNVRSGPGAEYDRLGSLVTNQEVQVTGKCNEYDWYRINYNENESYVSCDYLVDKKVSISNDNTTNDEDAVVDDDAEEDVEDLESSVPSTPEPAYGTIVYDAHPQDGWIWCPIDSFDEYTFIYDGWHRCVSQGTLFAKKQDFETLQKYSLMAFPLKDGPGEEDEEVHYPTIWVYFGDGPM